ncbi:MAG: glucosamine-6-phosphate deaminase [Verrucomicrobia bacterium]|nr:glucosamine-6-phosphate deaminase [Verrucomicrobiota bacterium]
MEIVIKPDYDAMSRCAADFVETSLRRKPDLVIGLATGSTPLGLYRELARRHREEGLSFAHATTFNLDEYIGLPADHPQSYHSFMRESFFRHVDLDASRTHLPDGNAADIAAECAAYEAAIRAAGGIDLQVLGIGNDGHIGFNEPSSSLRSRTRIKTLTEQTVRANARFFGGADKVPHHAITVGVGTIFEARQCLLLASGPDKAAAVAAAVEGPLTAMCPASALQFHDACTLILDETAAVGLKRGRYYRYVYDTKPAWQQWEKPAR